MQYSDTEWSDIIDRLQNELENFVYDLLKKYSPSSSPGIIEWTKSKMFPTPPEVNKANDIIVCRARELIQSLTLCGNGKFALVKAKINNKIADELQEVKTKFNDSEQLKNSSAQHQLVLYEILLNQILKELNQEEAFTIIPREKLWLRNAIDIQPPMLPPSSQPIEILSHKTKDIRW